MAYDVTTRELCGQRLGNERENRWGATGRHTSKVQKWRALANCTSLKLNKHSSYSSEDADFCGERLLPLQMRQLLRQDFQATFSNCANTTFLLKGYKFGTVFLRFW